MHKLALAASAVALASVMAMFAGPANAQMYGSRAPIVDTGVVAQPGYPNRFVNRYFAPRYVNRYSNRGVVDTTDYTNYAPLVGPSWGLMRPPGYSNRYNNRYLGPGYGNSYVNYGPRYGNRYMNYGNRYVNRCVVQDPAYTNYQPLVGGSWGLMRPPGFSNRYVNC
ncbi:hypothetical protein PRN20_20180 [Devosia sp. ZB163]|uniref:hypothetical protein n=1 Tax=Devosia sp. ZB163 TaxID=3025938 RepID=UPI002360173D|nr:hypothetical protein [Devosia sp. ZB163]MDC9826061.1 hypothetical protein [Devosia sp. ZB163]